MELIQVISIFNNIRAQYTGTVFLKTKTTPGNLRLAQKIFTNAEAVNIPVPTFITAQFEILKTTHSPKKIYLGYVASVAAVKRAEEYDRRRRLNRYDAIRTVKLDAQQTRTYWAGVIEECASKTGVSPRTVEAVLNYNIPGGIY